MIRLFSAVAALVLLATPSHANDAPTGPVILTVAGAVTETNRGPFDAAEDSFLGYHERTFEKAAAFDLEMLAAFPQSTITANLESWDKPITATGPLLADVMSAVGVAEDATVIILGLDGYAVDLDAATRGAQDWILATSVDGKALGVGDKGPLWVLHDTGGAAASEEESGSWVWTIFYIEAQ